MSSRLKTRLLQYEPNGFWLATIIGLFLVPILPCLPAQSLGQVSEGRPASANPSASDAVSVAAQLREASSLLQRGKADEAEPILRLVISASPLSSDAHNLLGIILDQRGQFKEAEQEYRAALQLSQTGISPLANLGVLLIRTGRSEEAIKTFETVLQRSPNHPQATVNLGLQYVARGDHARAVPLLEQAIQLGLDGYEVRYSLGIALYNLKRYDEAVTSLQSALALSPNSAEPFYQLGLVAWASGQDEMAGELWEKAVSLRPNYPVALFMLGEVLQKHGRLDAARKFYERALEQDPGKPGYYVRLGSVHIQQAHFLQALNVFRRAAKRFPEMSDLHYFVGLAARGVGDYELARTSLHQSLSLKADNVDTLALLGAISSDRGNPAEAERLLRRAVALDDRHFNSHHDLGGLLVRNRRYADALPVLQRAAFLAPRNPDVHYKLFITLARLNLKDEAERELTIFKDLEGQRKAGRLRGDDVAPTPANNSPSEAPPNH